MLCQVRRGRHAAWDHWAALQEAWRPFAVACKALWWDCMAVPADAADEKNFRGSKILLTSMTIGAYWDMQCMASVGPSQRFVP